MADMLRDRLGEMKAKRSALGFAGDAVKGERSSNGVASDEQRLAGHVFGRAVECARHTPKSAADACGHRESSAISRLSAGLTVPPIIARFFADVRLRTGLIEALAELPGDQVTTETVVKIARSV
jgi:hypothetical protein